MYGGPVRLVNDAVMTRSGSMLFEDIEVYLTSYDNKRAPRKIFLSKELPVVKRFRS